MMELTILGGAGEHGRSSYLLQQGEQSLLLDYGVKKEGDGQYPITPDIDEMVASLQTVFLSHAHEDHCIALPLLYKHGYTGEVWTTRATVGQLPAYFEAWKRYTDHRSATRPYDDEDQQRIQFRYLEDIVPPGSWSPLLPHLDVCWGRAGHLPGSIWLALCWHDKYIFFSGDYTSESQLLAADRPLHQTRLISKTQTIPGIIPDLDIAIIDAAYGVDPDHQDNKLTQLKRHIDETLRQQGAVMLPVPVYGRGQELILWASEEYPDTPLLVEAGLLNNLRSFTTDTYWLHAQACARIERLLQHPYLYVMDDEQSRNKLTAHYTSFILFTDDGMMQSVKAQQHYERIAHNEHNAVIFTGHLAHGCFGRRLLLDTEREGCKVYYVRYKVHQGLPDVRRMLLDLKSPPALLVHATKSRTDGLALRLEQEGFHRIHSLLPQDKIQF